jgi:hypothetical protein
MPAPRPHTRGVAVRALLSLAALIGGALAWYAGESSVAFWLFAGAGLMALTAFRRRFCGDWSYEKQLSLERVAVAILAASFFVLGVLVTIDVVHAKSQFLGAVASFATSGACVYLVVKATGVLKAGRAE